MPNVTTQPFRWRTDEVEHDGPFGWHTIGLPLLFCDVIPKLQNFETMKWAEIEGGSSHFVDTDQLCDEAKTRLQEINKDYLDRLFSLRLTGTQRIWGYRELATFKILWWDPEHQVCPSPKKHT